MSNRILLTFSLVMLFLNTQASYGAIEGDPDPNCTSILLGIPANQASPAEKTIKQTVFSLLPINLRRAMARTSARALELHERALNERIAELIPPEATSQMAAMFQTSHDYLLSWLPVLPKSVALGNKLHNESDSETLWLNYFIDQAQKTTWAPRLKEAHQLLKELVELQTARNAEPSERAATYLRLALLHSYCYGFQSYLTGRRSPHDIVLNDSNGTLTVSGLEYFRQAIEIYESQLGPHHESVLTLKYLMLRHANNGILAHNNAQYRTFDGRRVPPDPIMAKFVEAAAQVITELSRELGSDLQPTTFSPRRVLFYYVQRELQKSPYYQRVTQEDGSVFGRSPAGSNFQGNALDLLLLIVKEAPKSWIDDQLDDPQRKKFLSYLISDSRWYIQTDLQLPAWKLIYDVQLHPENYNYESLIAVLNELGLLTNRIQDSKADNDVRGRYRLRPH